MSISQADLPYIKWSLLTFVTVLTIGGGAVIFSQKYASDAESDKRKAQQQMTDARNNLNAARDDQRNMAEYTKEFSAILRREIIGDEQRLNLIEGLEAMHNGTRVLNFNYGISPQSPYKPNPALDSGNYDLKFSPMKLQFELLHEGQLINFFDGLKRDMNGWFILEECTLEKTASAAAQLRANCAGGWLTMKNRNAK